jgi:tRNA pseudouridine55 synthase
MATGVLPILLGRATTLSSIMLDGNKRYTATVKLGVTTDTEDITGTVLSEKSVEVTALQLEEALKHFGGKITQTPPMYSAIKKDGVRLYDLARQGKSVEIPSREVEIFSIDLISPLSDDNTFVIDVFVSKGTYIRSLARDIGEYLGCGATLTALERTDTCGFSIDKCVNLDDLDAENLQNFVLPEETAVMHLRECKITAKQAERFSNGGQLDFSRLHIENIADGELFRVKCGDTFVGIGIADIPNQRLDIKSIINFYK